MRPSLCPRCKSPDVQFCRRSINYSSYPRWLCRSCLVLHELLPEIRSRAYHARADKREEAREKAERLSDYGILQQALRKTRRKRLPSTLTYRQWKTVITFFNDRCAYCTLSCWELVEHATPISRGGGTTVDNCLPCCHRCNCAKQARTIEECLSVDLWPHRAAQLSFALAWLQQNGRDAQGELVSGNDELTIRQAANLLSVSQQYLILLLDRNELPSIRLGENPPRLRFEDVLAYKAERDYGQQEVFDDLTVAT